MRRDAQAVLLVVLGVTVAKVALSEAHVQYVKAALGPALVVAGVALAVLGLVELVGAWSGREDADGDDADDGHGHGRAGSRVGWALLAPVLVIFLVAPGPLGAEAASRAGARGAPATTAPPLAPVADDGELSLADFTFYAREDGGAAPAGRSVVLVGFASPAPDGGW